MARQYSPSVQLVAGGAAQYVIAPRAAVVCPAYNDRTASRPSHPIAALRTIV